MRAMSVVTATGPERPAHVLVLRPPPWLWVALLFGAACASAPEESCTLALVVPSSTPPSVVSDCQLLTPLEVAHRLPPDMLTVFPAQRETLVAALVAAEANYYQDPAAGRAALESQLQQVVANPGLLPSDSGLRRQVYQALAVLMLARYNDSQQSGDELAMWLARHLPDQVPSAKELPPKLSVRAAEALRQAHAGMTLLTVTAPPDCTPASLLLDGRLLGSLPLNEVPVHTGHHAVEFLCQGVTSWVRLVDLTGPTRLSAPRVYDEAAIALRPGGLLPVPGVAAARRQRVEGRLMKALSADALVTFSPGAEGGAEVASLATRFPVSPGPDGTITVPGDSLTPRRWRPVVGWILAGVSVAALGTGLTLHALHDRRIEDMVLGTVDNREAADGLRMGALSSYAGAAATASGAMVLLFLEALPDPEIEPLF